MRLAVLYLVQFWVLGIDCSTIPTIAQDLQAYFRREYADADSINAMLTSTLLQRHTIKSRPVTHPEESLKVNVLSALYQIVDLDQRSNLATISAYFDLWWHDRYLMWNVSDFGGASSTYLPSETVWTPDLYLYHSVQGSTPLTVQQSAVQITYDGMVRVFIPFTARALCTINVKYFPFDTQQCEFVFGSWSYRVESVEYIVASEDVLLSDFYDNQEWILINSTLHKTTSLYTNSAFNETYSTVTLIVALQRQSFYYVFNLVLPVTLVTVVSVIGFHVPANSSERRESKFRLGIMTLLSMGVLLLNVVNDMPKFSMTSEPGKRGSFSDVPLLGLFYVALIVIISVGTMSTGVFVAIEKYALHHPTHIPAWLRWLDFDWPRNWTRVWEKAKAKRRRGDIEEKKKSSSAMASSSGDKTLDPNTLATPLRILDHHQEDAISGVDEDEEQGGANCISSSPKKAQASPRTAHFNHIDRSAMTPPSSYRRAIHSSTSSRRKVTPTSPPNLTRGDHHQTAATPVGLSKVCEGILTEITLIRRALEGGNKAIDEGVRDIVLDPFMDAHRHNLILSISWSRVIHRFEGLSLLVYLCLIGTALIMFFVHSWY